MQCCRYRPRLWNCRHRPKAGKLEVGYFLLAPWIQLFGTFAFLAPLGILACDAANPGASPAAVPAWPTGGGLYLLLGITPLATWGPLYVSRCEPATGLRGAIGYGLTYAVYIVVLFYVTSWRALFRILRGRTTWSKTRRNAETHQGTAAVET
ncbi:hypothetical protein AB8O64_28835 [Streptomyces sp. QH1-20]|uniref:hypothetical protein n=1 Tax=Streptomyces sp. QH1-20 TaxID=3240934 RepID=UPI003511C1AE